MPELGPAWLRRDLPHPIASAWHSFLERKEADGVTAVAAVEVALRFVSAVQIANLLAEGSPLPKALSNPGFAKPSLGAWLYLVKEAGKSIKRPFIRELGTWPVDGNVAKLAKRVGQQAPPHDELVENRNEYIHAGVKTAHSWDEDEQELIDLAVEVLGSLDWLRDAKVLVITDRRESGGHKFGRMKVFDSFVTDPPSHEQEWEGDPEPRRVYLASPDSEDELLDLEPFLRRTRLKRLVNGKPDERAPAEALCLWKGFENGGVLLSDDLQKIVEAHSLAEGDRRLVGCRLVRSPGSKGVTREDEPHRSTLSDVGHRARGRARLGLVVGGVALAVAVVAGVLIAATRETTSKDSSPASAVEVPSGSADKGAGTLRPADSGGGSGVVAEDPFAEHDFLTGFVDRFCRGAVSESDLATLESLARDGAVSVRALIALFNVYGAFYGYEFKSELWLNDLYYGAGATHLPASCRALVRTYRTEGEVPGHLESVRDRVKRIWRAVK